MRINNLSTMSNWKLKSEMSLNIAGELISEYSNQSVHCSYYSCVQYLYHLMSTSMNESEDDLNDGRTKQRFETSLPKRKDGSLQQIGTHVWLHKELFRSLRSRGLDEDKYDVEAIIENISTLSTVRVIADYKSEIIIPKRAEGIHKKASEFIEVLKEIY